MKNIVLIGMPGVGKSTVGVVLAKMAGMKFVDSDLVIQEKTGQLLSEIIAERGPDGFIEVENRINAEIWEKNAVIATGGSVVYGKEAMEHLKEIGTVIYLRIDCGALLERLGDLERRGVVLKDHMTFEDLYRERTVLYEKYADVTIDERGKTVEDMVREILKLRKKVSSLVLL